MQGYKIKKMGEVGQKLQNSIDKSNKFWGCNVQHGDYSYPYCIVFLKLLREEILKVLIS